jgi:hypothetical protein
MTNEDRQKLAAATEAALARVRSQREARGAWRRAIGCAPPWVPDMLGPQLVANCRRFASSGQLFGNSEEFDSPALRDDRAGV